MPRWFYALLAVCLVALTTAGALRLRYERWESGYVDTWRGIYCGLPGCMDLSSRTVYPLRPTRAPVR